MFALKTFEATPELQASNPLQRQRTVWTGPGGMQTFGWNPAPNPGALAGAGLGSVSSVWASLPTWGQLLIVGGAAATAGYFGMAKFGDKYVRPALAKVGLSGPRRRRRR